MDEGRHLHIALLHTGWIRHELARWLLLVAQHRPVITCTVQFYGGDPAGVPTSSNRNRIRRDRPAGSDLLMIDSDVIPPESILEIVLLDLDVVICPTPMWMGNQPDNPVISNIKMPEQQLIQVGEQSVIEIEAGGGSAFYVASRVLDDPRMRGAFQFVFDDDGVMVRTEDYEFCRRAKENGYTVHAALGYPCGHMKEINIELVFDVLHTRGT